jgi:phenylacetic acid degradation operon negative regulatory protein
VKPRGVILDLFGGYLRYVDGEVRLSHLTQLLGDFGIAPPTVRVTLSRLRREGWVLTRREGRETVYTLTEQMLDLLDEGRTRIFAPPAERWLGQWTMVLHQITESERQERNQLRKALAWHGFGPLTTSTWLAPGDRRKEVRKLVDGLTEEQVDVLFCTSEGLDHDQALARRCWDLETLSEQYTAFTRSHSGLVRRSPRLKGADALVQRTELIATYRHFPFQDPRLPPELRPALWPGVRAYEIFRAAHEALGPAARQYIGGVIGREVPEPDPDPPLP